MAQTKSKKLSRRQMVMLLGSGVVFAPASGSAAEPPPGKCGPVTPMRGAGAEGQMVLTGSPCCTDGVKVFKDGFKNLGRNSPVRKNFKDFDAALTASGPQLMDYCVMVWGLKEAEYKKVVEDMQSKYKLTQYK